MVHDAGYHVMVATVQCPCLLVSRQILFHISMTVENDYIGYHKIADRIGTPAPGCMAATEV